LALRPRASRPQLKRDPLGGAGESQAETREGHMDPAVFLVALVTVVGTAAVTIFKVARLWAPRPESPSADVTARLEVLERDVQGLQQQQAETQERLDFAERLLSKAREERRIGS